MGLIRPSTQAEELDPRWQRRRQVLLASTAFLGLVIAVAVAFVWLGDVGSPAVLSEPQQAPSSAAVSPSSSGTAGPPRPDPSQVVQPARASLQRADPWVIEWLRAWDRAEGLQSTIEDRVQAVQVLLMVGDIVDARAWHQRLVRAVSDPGLDRSTVDPELWQQLRLLDLVMAGLVESAMAEMVRLTDERELSPEERLLKILIRRELAGGDLGAGWATELIELARENHRGGALARLLVVQFLERGAAEGMPRRVLASTGDARLQAAATGQEVDPPLRSLPQELGLWLRPWFEEGADEVAAQRMVIMTLDWGLAEDDETADEIARQALEWAFGLSRQEQIFVAEWLALRGAWEEVVELLHPNRPVPLTPRSMNLYAAAMHELGREAELAVEMGRHNTRWPEPLVLYWTAREALGGSQRSALPMVEGSLVRAGRVAQAIDPTWTFDFARTAFEAGFEDTGQQLLLLATAEEETRERGLRMLLDRLLQQGDGVQALYVVEQLRVLDRFPGPWHGMWLWLKLMVEENPGGIVGEARLWLQSAEGMRATEAHFIGAMAAALAGDDRQAGSWAPRVNAAELPARYLLFYFALIEHLGLEGLLAGPLERRVGEPPAFLTREEALWLERLQARGFPAVGGEVE